MTLIDYQYSIVRFVPDVARGEAANLGVIVSDDSMGLAHTAFLPDVRSKIGALAPAIEPAIVQRVLNRWRRQADQGTQVQSDRPPDGQIRSSSELRTLSASMRNQLQVSEPKTYRARSAHEAVCELYDQLVAPLGAPAEPDAEIASIPHDDLDPSA